MKKLVVFLSLASVISMQAMYQPNPAAKTQAPPSDVQALMQNKAEIIESIIAKVKTSDLPEAKNIVQRIETVRQKLDARMKTAQAQKMAPGSQPPADLQPLIQENGTLLQKLFDYIKTNGTPELQNKIKQLEDLSQNLDQKMLQYSPDMQQSSAPTTAPRKKATKIE